MKVAVIGSGGWGTALALACAANGHEVALWSYFKEESERLSRDGENKEFLPGVKFEYPLAFTSDMGEAVDGAEMVISAVPSNHVRTTAKNLAPFADGKLIVSVSKGLETGSSLRLSEVIKEEMPKSTVAVLSGPSHAEEVARKIPTTLVVACEDESAAAKVQDVFMSAALRVYTNDDVCGVEIGGALKNVVALCAGVTDGLGFGDNTKAALMTRGLAEIARLGVKMGARRDTFAGLTGVGDLIVTCTSMHSRNRRAGILLGKGKSLDEALQEVHMTVEGVTATRAAYEIAKKYGVDMPIVNAAYAVLFENKDPREAVYELMGRNRRAEREADIL